MSWGNFWLSFALVLLGTFMLVTLAAHFIGRGLLRLQTVDKAASKHLCLPPIYSAQWNNWRVALHNGRVYLGSVRQLN